MIYLFIRLLFPKFVVYTSVIISRSRFPLAVLHNFFPVIFLPFSCVFEGEKQITMITQRCAGNAQHPKQMNDAGFRIPPHFPCGCWCFEK
jgi:hypothetical protein